MKSATYPKRIFRALSEKSAFLAGVVVVATALCVVGCTSRKQYAINEAILISERRQLEDEIYRSKFELRDALRENQRLREQLEKEGLASSSAGKKSNAEKKPTLDENQYPGGTALQVDRAKIAPSYQRAYDPDQYDSSPTNNVETLPDFVPVPTSKARTKYSQAGAPEPLRQVAVDVPASKKSFGITQPVGVEPIESQPQEQETFEESVPGFDAQDVDWSPVGLL